MLAHTSVGKCAVGLGISELLVTCNDISFQCAFQFMTVYACTSSFLRICAADNFHKQLSVTAVSGSSWIALLYHIKL